MGSLSAAATYSAGFLGSYLAPDAAGEGDSIGKELEISAAALYTLSQKRLNQAFGNGIPAETEQLRRDVSRAQFWFKLAPNHRLHTAGVSNAVMKTASDQLNALFYGLSKFMSPTLQASAEMTLRAAARGVALHLGMARSVEFERLRKIRDDGMAMLLRHIELAAGVRGVADALGNAAIADMGNAASERLSRDTQALNLQKIAWSKEQSMRAIQDGEDGAMGSVIGNFLGGMGKGYTAGG